MTLRQIEKLGETYGSAEIESSKGDYKITLGEAE